MWRQMHLMAMGGVLLQYLDGKWCPFLYFSLKLSPTEPKLPAIYRAICDFKNFIEDQEFYVLTITSQWSTV